MPPDLAQFLEEWRAQDHAKISTKIHASLSLLFGIEICSIFGVGAHPIDRQQL